MTWQDYVIGKVVIGVIGVVLFLVAAVIIAVIGMRADKRREAQERQRRMSGRD